MPCDIIDYPSLKTEAVGYPQMSIRTHVSPHGVLIERSVCIIPDTVFTTIVVLYIYIYYISYTTYI